MPAARHRASPPSGFRLERPAPGSPAERRDLDKTYKIIRQAVEAAGLECIRADDIVHSGVIDKPMYESLLTADVAIADLSTSRPG